jgi:hypothetical protein
MWWSAGSTAVLVVGVPVVVAVAAQWALALLSVTGTALAGFACYQFVDQRLALRDAVGVGPVCAVAVGSAGIAVGLTGQLNQWFEHRFGIDVALLGVGPVEELSKLALPVALWVVLALQLAFPVLPAAGAPAGARAARRACRRRRALASRP